MKFALIKAGIVVNIVEADGGFQPENGFTAVQTDIAVIGDHYVGGQFVGVCDVGLNKAAKWDAIKGERDRRSEAGCLVAGYWFHNDLKSRTQWERMANRATTQEDADPYLVDGEQVTWKTMSGAFVPLTAGLIRQVVDAFEIQEVAIFKAAETHRAQMEAAAEPAAYDYSGNWPQVL